MYNLLHDELIGIHTARGPHRVSLPGLYARLVRGEVEGYTGLRAHQEDPWRVFLVQVAASILARRPREPLPDDETFWREGLLDLSEGKANAWELVVEDVTRPALWQHPLASKEELAQFKPKASTPDELDVLVTAKNHDVKMARMGAEEAEAWLYALMMLQTTSGYLGAGNFGIVRMNGGFASRPILSWVEHLAPSARFREELEQVMAQRAALLAGPWGYRDNGVVLTWLTPWDGKEHQFQLKHLEPWFVEAPRRIRLELGHGRIQARSATSSARQIGPKAQENGDVGDPWIPIKVEDRKKGRSALTLTSKGFTAELVCDLVFRNGIELTPLQEPRPGDGTAWFAGSVLVRGQGTTEGYYAFAVPVPPKARMRLLKKDTRDPLGKNAQALLNDAKDVARALRFGLTLLAEGGPEQADFGAEAVKKWIEATTAAYTKGWEDRFFPTLWRSLEEDFEQVVRPAWRDALRKEAERLLDRATEQLPVYSNRLWRGRVQAKNAFYGLLRKQHWTFDRHDLPEEALA